MASSVRHQATTMAKCWFVAEGVLLNRFVKAVIDWIGHNCGWVADAKSCESILHQHAQQSVISG